MKDSKRYYYSDGKISLQELGVEHLPIPCSPELIKQLGTEAREVVLGEHFELEYEILSYGQWVICIEETYDNYKDDFRRITAIPVKAVEGVKAEAWATDEDIRRYVMQYIWCYEGDVQLSKQHESELKDIVEAVHYFTSLKNKKA